LLLLRTTDKNFEISTLHPDDFTREDDIRGPLWHAVWSEERTLRSSARATAYADYKKRTGMFIPWIVRHLESEQ
jgi:hypothetical protein